MGDRGLNPDGTIARGGTLDRVPSANAAVLAELSDDLGPWLAAEYTAVHGERAPRPDRAG